MLRSLVGSEMCIRDRKSCQHHMYLALTALLLLPLITASPAPRLVRVSNQQFVLSATNQPIVMTGPNVVVKAPPYMPSVSGDTYCPEDGDQGSSCGATGSCKSCTTFNHADVEHIKAQGWNSIRLGIVWAGAQPRDEDALDPEFVNRLHAVLNLTDATGLHVVLDNHGDMVGSAGCGNGVPMWFQKKAAPDLIGKPLTNGFPFDLPIKALEPIQVDKTGGYGHCGDNATMWAAHAGDPNYNLLNECCLAMNSGNPGGLGYTRINQATMDSVVKEGAGRDDFVRFWRLVAEAVVDHPSAFGAELMNEPMSIRRRDMFDTWRACTEAINLVIPDMSVSLADTGEEPVFPKFLTETLFAIDHDTVDWIKNSQTSFYAVHYPSPALLAKVLAIQKEWNVPSFATEMNGCDQWNRLGDANISRSYWHYANYCNTGQWFGNRKVPDETFGGCMLGWDGGNSTHFSDTICH
eukprot:TRINITY_DN23716_c0_g1_i1.p1 TRINITY_DN23716_c0_g1~~TRINITY_DN23716_c0_g1_i1.p1  ORF type:complete len:464 (-),score=104.16 TRINITY_DN23716_c0_g1_i1:187-1578(-)